MNNEQTRKVLLLTIFLACLILSACASGAERALFLVVAAALYLYHNDIKNLGTRFNTLEQGLGSLKTEVSTKQSAFETLLASCQSRMNSFEERLSATENRVVSPQIQAPIIQSLAPATPVYRSLWPAAVCFMLVLIATNSILYNVFQGELTSKVREVKESLQSQIAKSNVLATTTAERTEKALSELDFGTQRINDNLKTISYDAWATNCTRYVSRVAPLACWNFSSAPGAAPKSSTYINTRLKSEQESFTKVPPPSLTTTSVTKSIDVAGKEIQSPLSIVAEPKAKLSEKSWTQNTSVIQSSRPQQRREPISD